MHKLVYVLVAIIAVILVLGNSEKNQKPNPNVRYMSPDDPQNPMRGIRPESNCNTLSQMKGIYNCPYPEPEEK